MADLCVRGVRFNVVRLGSSSETQPPDPYRDGRCPVVFLHGLIMDNLSSFYYTVAPAVAAKTDTVLFDLRGHGRSDRPPNGYRIEDGVDDLVGILDALGIDEPVHLVANSFGGTIALAAALRRPERVAGMVLIEAHPAFTGWGDEIMEDLSDLVSGFDDPGIRDYLAQEAPRTLRRMVQTCEDLVTVSSMGDDLRASQPTDPDRLATLSCPTLLLYGENSDIIDRAYVLEESIPGAELVVVDGCSHALLMENPKEVEGRVTAWLDDQAGVALSRGIGAGIR
ncbi:MAG TPA: alpha/beta hydrolase [Acidimicrobiales bacterium]|jgi:pimeloyl-ACP methyl ester carboxylesterase|nr:alpha/beta hydrolase [Acidimicrobiales bacterium]